MKKIQEQNQALLGRNYVVYEHQVNAVTPSRKDIQVKIASMEKSKPQLVTIKKIDSVYGTSVINISAYVYSSEADYKRSVPAYLSKKSVVEEPKVEEKPVEAEKSEESVKKPETTDESAEKPAEESKVEEDKKSE